ncbi:MAG: GH39 family glycosyl hydrolase [Planctomycetota bacterium]|jgi:xylan 1,4-beta-xylosidase
MSEVKFRIDAGSEGKPFPHYWEKCVGSGHALLALRKDWQQQMKLCHDRLGFEYVRFHGILNDDVGVYSNYKGEDTQSFYNVDSIIDFLLEIGMKPFVELSFMPLELASGDETIFHYKGNRTPPKDYKLWETVVEQLMNHWLERYGLEELRTWYYEVWNEPNLKAFWTGGLDGYLELYKASVNVIKKIDPELKVGGPSTARNEWIPELIDYCKENNLPLDFVSTHHYPTTSALGFTDMEDKLANAKRGVLTEQAAKCREEAGDLPLFYTEWNNSPSCRDRFHDETFAAAFAVKTIADNDGIVDIYAWWAFNDVFEEKAMPNEPFHGGFGLLNYHGIPKPTFHAFEFLHHSGDMRLEVAAEGTGVNNTVEALVTKKEDGVQLIIYNHHMIRQTICEESVAIRIDNCFAPSKVTIRKVDDENANAKNNWQKIGAPQFPFKVDVDKLRDMSVVREEELAYEMSGKSLKLNLTIPPHGVYAVDIKK